MELITISDAAILSGKSIQTIRRMIKQKKIVVKRQKTPQGFNYLIIKESLLSFFAKKSQQFVEDGQISQDESRQHRPLTSAFEEIFKNEIQRFAETIRRLVDEHERDKSNWFQLIKTFQDRIVSLEGDLKMLQAPKSSWWHFWK